MNNKKRFAHTHSIPADDGILISCEDSSKALPLYPQNKFYLTANWKKEEERRMEFLIVYERHIGSYSLSPAAYLPSA